VQSTAAVAQQKAQHSISSLSNSVAVKAIGVEEVHDQIDGPSKKVLQRVLFVFVQCSSFF
jgi:hypothetical protein